MKKHDEVFFLEEEDFTGPKALKKVQKKYKIIFFLLNIPLFCTFKSILVF